MRVVERFRREGDAIFYDVTVEDPEVLVEPLVIPTRVTRPNAAANAGLSWPPYQAASVPLSTSAKCRIRADSR